MASLTGNLVAETYKALLKTIDNDILTASEKQITDGFGGGSNVFIDSNGFLRANKYKVTNGLATQFLKADGSLDANTYLTSITSSQIITALGYTPVTNARTLTINGTTYDLTANRSWTVAGTAAIWGNITGTLSDQTDLQTALNAKFNNPTGTISQYIRGDGSLATFPAITGFVPYTGATENVDLGTHTLLARDLVINHASASGTAVDITKGGSGIAVNIEKSGSGEALTVVKSSGSGNAASITGGTTLISELHLTTKLADAYILSAATWNAKQNALNGTGFVKASGTTISYDNSTYLTTADAALTYLALTGGTLTGSITATSFIKTGGTSNEYLRADGSVNVITGDIISGSGTAGYIAKFGSSAVIASSNLFESGANIGFGTITLNYGSYGRAFTGAGFGSTSFGFEAVTGSTTNGALIGGLSLVIAGNDSTRRIGSAIQSYISGATSTHQGADLRFFAKPDNGVLAEIVRIASNLITFNRDLTAANITATTFVKSGGTASEFLMADGSVSTFSSPVSGSGSAGYIPKWTSASNLGSSFMYDDGTSIGIAYTTPNRGGYGRALSGASFGSASFGFEAVSNTTTNGGLVGGLSFIIGQNDSSRIVGSAIQSNLVGTTGTNFGADLRFFAKADAGVISEVARMTSAGLRVYGTIIKDGGTASQYLMADGSVTTLSGVVTGTGTTGSIPKWSSASNLVNSILTESASGIGIGIASANGNLQFSNASNTRKIVLYEGANNDFQFYGFGIESSTLVYSTFAIGDDHVFFSGRSTTTRSELARIKGNGNALFAGTLNVKNSSTIAGLSATVNATGEFMSTGTVSGYFWENRSGGVTSNSNWYGWYTTSGLIKLYNGSSNLLSISGTSGNMSIGSDTDAGYKLDVNGNTRISSSNGISTIFGGGSSFAINILKGGLTAGSAVAYLMGLDNSVYNQVTMLFNYAGYNSTSNYFGLGFYGADNLFKIYPTGAAIFSSTLNVNGVLTITSPSSSEPIVLNGTANSQYIAINSVTGAEAMTKYYNPTAGNWYTGIRTSAGISSTSSYHIYSSTYGGDIMAIDVGGNTILAGKLLMGYTSLGSSLIQVNGNIRMGTWTTAGSRYLGFTRDDDGTWGVGGASGFEIESVSVVGNYSQNVHLWTHWYNNGSRRALTARYDGKIGINTTSPSKILTVRHSDSDGVRIEYTGNTDNLFLDASSVQAYSNTTPSFLKINGSGGNVAIGINTDAGAKLRVHFDGGNGSSGLGSYNILATTPSTSSVYQATIGAIHPGDGYGNLNLGGNGVFWHISKRLSTNDNQLEYYYYNGSGFQSRFIFSTAGNLTATAFFESSDMRLKTLIDGSPQVAGIENLEAKLYEKEGKMEFGYFAQDAEKYMPYSVSKNTDGFLTLSYREVHTAKIARLEQRVAELEKQLNLN
jgi:hypothetical protein